MKQNLVSDRYSLNKLLDDNIRKEYWIYVADRFSALEDSEISIVCDTSIFVVCSKTFTLFRLIKTAVPVEISRYSFRVFSCACIP